MPQTQGNPGEEEEGGIWLVKNEAGAAAVIQPLMDSSRSVGGIGNETVRIIYIRQYISGRLRDLQRLLKKGSKYQS